MRVHLIILVLPLVISMCCAQESNETTIPTTITTTQTATTTIEPSTTTTIQTPTTTSEPPETTTTQTPTTNPTTTTTHTPATTTERPTTSTTTQIPITTTETPTTTTTISPEPEVPIYEVKDDKGQVCVAVQSMSSLTIPYLDTKNATQRKDFDLKTERINSTGNCTGNDTSYMQLSWRPPNATFDWILKINFSKMDQFGAAEDKPKYGASSINLFYVVEPSVFPDAKGSSPMVVSAEGAFFKAKIGNYYSCRMEETVQLKSQNDTVVLMHTKDIKVEAFYTSKDKEIFVGSAESCSADSPTSSLVPILVGVGLAVMILVALVVFLIGSRRRAAVYESI